MNRVHITTTPWKSAGQPRHGKARASSFCQGPASEVSVGPRSSTFAKGLFQGWPTITARMGLAPTGDLDGQHFFVLRPNNEVHPGIPTHQVRRQGQSEIIDSDGIALSPKRACAARCALSQAAAASGSMAARFFCLTLYMARSIGRTVKRI